MGIVAAALRKYKTADVEKALECFSSGVAELSSCMLLQIEDNQRETAAKILRWVVMAVRPLTYRDSWLESHRLAKRSKTEILECFTLLYLSSYLDITALAQNLLLKKRWLLPPKTREAVASCRIGGRK